MSDVDVMAAIIEQHARAQDSIARSIYYRVTSTSAHKAAEALLAAGFRMGAGTVDREQNERLKAIEGRLDRIEGYMVIK
ncbi:hypothetical protein SEA_NANOSMITE_90 [Mycobacterium phage Nanosmite]|nr:hypothetical protein SEA_NANOSMITE_90 [Mycobacterium phage Nanosmite]